MSQYARDGSRTICAWKYDDDDVESGAETWTDIQGLSKAGRLTMRCCGKRAKARPSVLGLRHFAHLKKNPNCGGGEESPEHELLKTEAARTAHKLGFEAEEEFPRDIAVPDVSIWDRATGKKIAVEIQLSSQTGHITRERALKRASMQMEDTVWFFKHRRNFEDVTLHQEHILPFLLPEGGDIRMWAATVRTKLTDYLTGNIYFDKYSDLANVPCSLVGYDFPCGSCGVVWYRTSFAVVLPNRIRGDFGPFAIPLGRLPDPVKTLRKSEHKIGKPTGKVVGAGLDVKLVCPACGAMPEEEFLDPFQVAQAPFQGLSGKHDMAWKLSEDRPKKAWKYKAPPYEETCYSQTYWKSIVDQGVAQILRERERVAEERRRAELEEYRARERERHAAETRRERAKREAEVEKKTAARIAAIEQDLGEIWEITSLREWMNTGLHELQGSSMRQVIRGHFHTIYGTRIAARSPADHLMDRIMDPADAMKSVDIGITAKGMKILKAGVRKAHRKRYPRSALQRLVDTFFP